MIADRFDTVLRSLSQTPSRRNALRLLAGSALGGLLTREAGGALAKKGGKGKHKGKNEKGKKVTLCHNGQTITVSKSAAKGHKKHGDTAGPCPSEPTPPGSVLTYQCPGPKNSGVSGSGTERFAQTFTAERSGSLRQIQFSVIEKSGTSGDYLVQLLKVIGGKPSHSPMDVLAAVTIPDAEVATNNDATVTATFAGTPLVAGTEYAVALSRPGVGLGEITLNTQKGGGGACGGQLFIAVAADVFAPEIFAQDTLVSVLVQ
jgi:hypothetical protein